ncbi:sulfite oxidase [Streptomyces sp. NPDC091272]|uniref:sulfite oxidase n=1 Tax=Streptomyces sp. NPDC091272 TaxID=3365981 RepID=UPI00382A971C
MPASLPAGPAAPGRHPAEAGAGGAGPDRRRVLGLAAAAGAGVPLTALLGTGTVAARTRPAAPVPTLPGVVKPLPAELFTLRGTNAETRSEALRGTGHLTPVDRFFVRNHTSTPRIDATTWKLTVWGSGLRGGPVDFSYADLRALPAVTRTAFIECAGNGRSFFTSQQGQAVTGTAWTLGAVGAARWRGARLADVLRRAGISPDAVDVMPRGLDGEVVTDGVNQGRVRRPLPVAKALDDVILAYEMNGLPLPPDHGFPVRVVVPSWVGVASVKWVGDIEVSDTPLASPWNTGLYRLFGEAYPAGGSAPLTRQALKSVFELPAGARFALRRPYRLTGRSWSGGAPVRLVEVSTDGGERWRRARLLDVPRRGDWVRWAAEWLPRTAGPTTLLARATDAAGYTQPAVTVHNTQGYLFDAVVRHPVTVG